MITIEEIKRKEGSLIKQVEEYNKLKWYKTNRGVAAIFLILLSLAAPLFFTIGGFVFSYLLIKKTSAGLIITAKIYAIILGFVVLSRYVESKRDVNGDFSSSPDILYFIIFFTGVTVFFLYKAYKVEKLRSKK